MKDVWSFNNLTQLAHEQLIDFTCVLMGLHVQDALDAYDLTLSKSPGLEELRNFVGMRTEPPAVTAEQVALTCRRFKGWSYGAGTLELRASDMLLSKPRPHWIGSSLRLWRRLVPTALLSQAC